MRGFLLRPGNKGEHSETPASWPTNWSQSLDQLVPVVDVVLKHLPTAPSSGQKYSLQRIPAREPGGFYFHFQNKPISHGRSDGGVGKVKGYRHITCNSFYCLVCFLNTTGANLLLKGQSQGQFCFELYRATCCGIISVIQTIWSCQTVQQSLIKPTRMKS